jgi:hypothetical protein
MNAKGRSLLTLCVVGLALSICVIALACDDASGQIPTITVEINDEDERQTAHSTNVFSDLLTFHGNITLAHPAFIPGTTKVITPVVEFPTGVTPWETIPNPPELTFTSQGTKNYTIKLRVPTGLLATDLFPLTFTAEIEGLVRYDLKNDDGIVSIAQYYIINRQFSTEPVKVKQGQSVDFNLTLINKGNGADTFSLAVTNEEELAFYKVFIFFEQSKRVQPDQEVKIALRLEAADDAKVGELQLNITIRSDESRSDPDHAEVINGAEFTIVIEPSIISSIKDYWYLVAIAVGVVVGVVVVLKVRSDKAFEKEYEEYERAQAEKAKTKTKAKAKSISKAKTKSSSGAKAKRKGGGKAAPKDGPATASKESGKPPAKRPKVVPDDVDAEDDL